MNKTQLAAAVAERTGASPTEARRSVDAVLDSISTAVASGDRVALLGFGTFSSAERPARTARNPRTGATIAVPAAVVPRFRVGAAFKARVGEGAPAPVVTGTATADPGERQGAKPSAKKAKKVAAKPAPSSKKSAPAKSSGKKAAAEKVVAAEPSTKASKKSADKPSKKASAKKSSKGKKKK
jgi:DNA-binding protein HU-beta